MSYSKKHFDVAMRVHTIIIFAPCSLTSIETEIKMRIESYSENDITNFYTAIKPLCNNAEYHDKSTLPPRLVTAKRRVVGNLL